MTLKEIGKAIQAEAAKYPTKAEWLNDPGNGTQAVITVDGLTVRCDCHREAVQAVAERYIKGKEHKPHRPSPARSKPRRVFSSVTFKEFQADGEIDNAIEYARAFGPDLVPQQHWSQVVRLSNGRARA